MNYFVSFDLSVLPHHWHDHRRQHATTSKYFWEWQVIFLYFALACWSCLVFQWQRSRFPCLCFVTCHVRMSSHPNKLALIYSGNVTPLLFSCFISVEVLEIWFQLQLKCNVAASVGATEKTGGDLWAPVPLSLLCTELSFAVSPPLGSWERGKKIWHSKNMKYHVSAGWVWGSWVLSVWKVRPDEIPWTWTWTSWRGACAIGWWIFFLSTNFSYRCWK